MPTTTINTTNELAHAESALAEADLVSLAIDAEMEAWLGAIAASQDELLANLVPLDEQDTHSVELLTTAVKDQEQLTLARSTLS